MRTPLLLALLLGTLLAPPAMADDTNAELIRYYRRRENYRAVEKDVLDWHKTKKNACVAFASEALRHIGITIERDRKIDGEGVSRITRAFSTYLEESLGWERIDDLRALKAGDIVFTTDASCCPGYPDHVMVFHSWSNKKRGIAKILDNQGFTHARDLENGSADESPFAYALRAPAARDAK